MLKKNIFLSFSHIVLSFVLKFVTEHDHLEGSLTHYQTTNFGLFQTERVCRRQFQIWQKWQKVIQMGRKHYGKKEKLLITSNFSFSHSVFKRLVSQGHEKVSLCGNGLSTGFLGQVTFISFGETYLLCQFYRTFFSIFSIWQNGTHNI